MKSEGMQIVNSGERPRAAGLLLIFAVCLFCLPSFGSAATNTVPARSQRPSGITALPVDVARLQFSPGVGDIVRMVRANVDPIVIKTFISHSAISYKPSAQEIIALKKLGVPDEIVATMIGHRPRMLERPERPVQAPPIRRAPPPEEIAASPGPPFSVGYPFLPYVNAVRTFTSFGPLSSFNNSYPTFVNGYPVYSGYFLPSYALWW